MSAMPDESTLPETLTRWEEVLNAMARLVLRDRMMVRVLVLSLILDVCLTVGIGYGAVHLHTVSVDAQRAACLSGNQARADNRRLWEDVISLSNSNHSANSTIVEFEKYLNAATKPRICG
jgi:hypothetical protein